MPLIEDDTRSAAIRSQAEIHAKIAHLYSLDRVERTVFNRAFNAYWNRLTLAMFPPDRGIRILDLMGGTGILSRAIQAEGYGNLMLLDLSIDMLRLAQSSLGGVRRLCSADAMRLPYQDETFDLVVCRGGLHHLPDLPDAVREIRRVLRNGGTFLAFDPCDDLLLIRGVRRLMYRLFAFFDADNERGLATREVTTALATTGFDIIEVKRFGFVGYLASGVEAHLFPRLFGCFPRLDRAAAWLCRIDERLEGSPFLLAAAYKAVKRSGDAP